MMHAAAFSQLVSFGSPSAPGSYENDLDRLQVALGRSDDGVVSPLCGMSSIHSNAAEDRRFRWAKCRVNSIPQREASGFNFLGITHLDALWTKVCHSNQLLYLVASAHYNPPYEDREFQFGCIGLKNTVREDCTWSTGTGYDQPFSFYCKDNYVMAGVHSGHSNGAQDRFFRFLCCRLRVTL